MERLAAPADKCPRACNSELWVACFSIPRIFTLLRRLFRRPTGFTVPPVVRRLDDKRHTSWRTSGKICNEKKKREEKKKSQEKDDEGCACLPGVRNSTMEPSTVTRPSLSTRRSATSCHVPSSIRCFDDFTFTGPLPRSACRYRWPLKISKAKRSCCKKETTFYFYLRMVKSRLHNFHQASNVSKCMLRYV